MDVLSEILKIVRPEGALFFNAEFSAPWCISGARSADLAHLASPRAGHLIVYHLLTEGRACAMLPDGRQEDLVAGDIVIFPHGDAHVFGNGPAQMPAKPQELFAEDLTCGLKPVRYGGGGEITRFVGGCIACEPRLSEAFLSSLPAIFKINVRGQPSGRSLEYSIRTLVGEAVGSDADNGLLLANLPELLLLESLRSYINQLPPGETGWLAGARDPVISQALAIFHKEPAYPWSLSELARRVGLSRTRLAARFRYFIGEPPMAYLARWRLKLGAEILQTSGGAVAEVAAAVGYGSDAAFNRAFKREFACPPAQFRRKKRAPLILEK